MHLHFFLFFLSSVLLARPTLGVDIIANIEAVTDKSFFVAKLGCNLTCGNITIPYPFGIGAGCSLNPLLAANCDTSVNPPKLFHGNFEVLAISQTQVRVRYVLPDNFVSLCVNPNMTNLFIDSSLISSDWPYTFSTVNKIIVVGCNYYGVIYGPGIQFNSGCASVCSNISTVPAGDCNGVGCCENDIPKGMTSYRASLGAVSYGGQDLVVGNCSYAFLAEQDSFQFRGPQDLLDSNFSYGLNDRVAMVLDFVFGNQSCAEALNSNESLCQQNTKCIDRDTGYSGYLCRCNTGYEGNSYLSPGCSDIDECKDPNLNDCAVNSICINTPGSFNCFCFDHYFGDGRTDGSGCVVALQFSVIEITLDPNLNVCDGKAVCQNTPRSFGCTCKVHYFGDGRIGGNGCIVTHSEISMTKLSRGHATFPVS